MVTMATKRQLLSLFSAFHVSHYSHPSWNLVISHNKLQKHLQANVSRLVNFGMNIASVVWISGYLGEIVNFALPILQPPWLAWGTTQGKPMTCA